MSKIKVIMFAGDKCAPCATLKPFLIEACAERDVPLSITHITPESDEIVQYKLRQVPTTIILDAEDNHELTRFVGVRSKEALVDDLEVWL